MEFFNHGAGKFPAPWGDPPFLVLGVRYPAACCGDFHLHAPSRRSSKSVGWGLISFGADLNFGLQKVGSFSGLTSPRSTRECRQNPVRPSHGVRAVDELCAYRASLRRQRGRAHAVVCRAVPGDGLRATHLAREPARHRGQPVGQRPQALRDGLSRSGQALHAGRRQRIARLAHLVRSGHLADPPRTQAVRERCARCRVGQHGVRAGRHHHRSVFELVRLGALSLHQGGHQAAHAAGSAWLDSGVHPHQRRQAARRERAGHAQPSRPVPST